MVVATGALMSQVQTRGVTSFEIRCRLLYVETTAKKALTTVQDLSSMVEASAEFEAALGFVQAVLAAVEKARAALAALSAKAMASETDPQEAVQNASDALAQVKITATKAVEALVAVALLVETAEGLTTLELAAAAEEAPSSRRRVWQQLVDRLRLAW